MPGPVFLAGERVTLRPIEREDLAFVQRNRNDRRVRRWLPRAHPQSFEDVESEFEGYMSETVGGANLLVCCDGERLGMVSLWDVDHASGRGRLAAWLAPEHHGGGYGTEAGGLLVDYAFAERRLDKLVAGALATNGPSRAVIEKLGFRQEGYQHDHYFVDGERVDRVVYGLLRGEWEGGRP